MSNLANVLVSLDGFEPNELALILEVIALKTGTRPPSPQERNSPRSGLFSRYKKGSPPNRPVTPANEANATVDPLEWELLRSAAFLELLQACNACAAPQLSGKGRKADMLNRVNSVRDAWNRIPKHLLQPFLGREAPKIWRATDQTEPSLASDPLADAADGSDN